MSGTYTFITAIIIFIMHAWILTTNLNCKLAIHFISAKSNCWTARLINSRYEMDLKKFINNVLEFLYPDVDRVALAVTMFEPTIVTQQQSIASSHATFRSSLIPDQPVHYVNYLSDNHSACSSSGKTDKTRACQRNPGQCKGYPLSVACYPILKSFALVSYRRANSDRQKISVIYLQAANNLKEVVGYY